MSDRRSYAAPLQALLHALRSGTRSLLFHSHAHSRNIG